MQENKSKCCNAEVKTKKGIGDEVNDANLERGSTYWYECPQCNKPCDIQPSKEEELKEQRCPYRIPDCPKDNPKPPDDSSQEEPKICSNELCLSGINLNPSKGMFIKDHIHTNPIESMLQDEKQIRRFYLNRLVDESGMSGLGKVAEGVVLPSGMAVMWWLKPPHSVQQYHSIDDLSYIHGHGVKKTTEIVYEKEFQPPNNSNGLEGWEKEFDEFMELRHLHHKEIRCFRDWVAIGALKRSVKNLLTTAIDEERKRCAEIVMNEWSYCAVYTEEDLEKLEQQILNPNQNNQDE